MLLPTDPNDDKNIIIELRAGTGGDEAALFVAEMFRVYLRLAEQHKLEGPGDVRNLLRHRQRPEGSYRDLRRRPRLSHR